jgi:hypothetical protein
MNTTVNGIQRFKNLHPSQVLCKNYGTTALLWHTKFMGGYGSFSINYGIVFEIGTVLQNMGELTPWNYSITGQQGSSTPWFTALTPKQVLDFILSVRLQMLVQA